jgi:hypothetical protein
MSSRNVHVYRVRPHVSKPNSYATTERRITPFAYQSGKKKTSETNPRRAASFVIYSASIGAVLAVFQLETQLGQAGFLFVRVAQSLLAAFCRSSCSMSPLTERLFAAASGAVGLQPQEIRTKGVEVFFSSSSSGRVMVSVPAAEVLLTVRQASNSGLSRWAFQVVVHALVQR